MECVLSEQNLPSFISEQWISKLLLALEEGNPTIEDKFQAEVCMSWIHWIADEPSLAFSRFPADLEKGTKRFPKEEALSGWTHVCIVKAAYIQGRSSRNRYDFF